MASTYLPNGFPDLVPTYLTFWALALQTINPNLQLPWPSVAQLIPAPGPLLLVLPAVKFFPSFPPPVGEWLPNVAPMEPLFALSPMLP
jgi:hypothetical protein